ncbi:hypothetical protein BREVNS_0137 [Brevinematales bacterium NS]|nr:hypothetical protein BREVNS_0137 [Brevinematales bacterium NS]
MDFSALRILKTLGKGKSGISYLAEYEGRHVVLKKMQNTEFYQLGNLLLA